MNESIVIRRLGQVDYQRAFEAMSVFTSQREASWLDEIWLLQHNPVFTLGMAGRMEHVHQLGDIPLVRTDRGGQVTYHGPGQLVIYLMLNLKRRKYGIRDYVCLLEQSVINYLEEIGIAATRRTGAPGVYTDEKKIAALGVRVRRSCTYHGLAINIDMDLEPFTRIDPCGYRELEVTQLVNYLPGVEIEEVERSYLQHLLHVLGENDASISWKSTLDDLLVDNAAA